MTDKEQFLKTYQNAVVEIEREIVAATEYIELFQANDLMYSEVRRFIVEGGKRFRPALSYVVASSFGQKDVYPHLALESFHKYLLAHDDIIDRDDIRYGKPTVHAKMTQDYSNTTDSEHIGRSLAIIGGDLMEAVTHKIILNSQLTPEVKIELEKLMVQAVEEVVWGWYDQFRMDYLSLDSGELSFERIEKSIIWVTGKYSVKLPLLFGFVVAGQKPPEKLEQFADRLGALYQTGDDLIGLFGEEKNTGKSNFGDIVQGKKTLPMWFSFEAASENDKATLTRVVGDKQASVEDIEKVREIIKQSGGLSRTEALMESYRQECLELIDAMNLSPELQQFFRGFITYIEKRDR